MIAGHIDYDNEKGVFGDAEMEMGELPPTHIFNATRAHEF